MATQCLQQCGLLCLPAHAMGKCVQLLLMGLSPSCELHIHSQFGLLYHLMIQDSCLKLKLCYDWQSVASLSWCGAPIQGPLPDFYYCCKAVGFLIWRVLSDERMGLYFSTAAGSSQHGCSWIQVLQHSWPYFPASNLRLTKSGGRGPHIYISQEQTGPVIPPGNGFQTLARPVGPCDDPQDETNRKHCSQQFLCCHMTSLMSQEKHLLHRYVATTDPFHDAAWRVQVLNISMAVVMWSPLSHCLAMDMFTGLFSSNSQLY
jgi:hypothetical protein